MIAELINLFGFGCVIVIALAAGIGIVLWSIHQITSFVKK